MNMLSRYFTADCLHHPIQMAGVETIWEFTHSSCYKHLIIANAVFDAALVVTICMSDLLRSTISSTLLQRPICKFGSVHSCLL